MLHPSVVESSIVGSPDPDHDEVVKAFIVPTSKASASASSTGQATSLVKELQDFCKNKKKHAAPYKYPRKAEFVDANFLLKIISGKINRGDLKKLEQQRYQEKNHNKTHLMSKM
jgi:medium-chain acyl-CoA synthetase